MWSPQYGDIVVERSYMHLYYGRSTSLGRHKAKMKIKNIGTLFFHVGFALFIERFGQRSMVYIITFPYAMLLHERQVIHHSLNICIRAS